mmetsp:Transcript_28470/g.69300  ORF Transcript_28470/g.69300 Transcript_28470/m.69300 type:complete len:455 (-) Transcript_28470:290-1654(-)|eukprot:CAMPEP_0113454088 /NCGR_PEP_ID=MMETSP0014_2-20120614/7686_1 /TAXON_ID=2857 /ORGANISM="Nitzschia sp." /LENGTH=454 /DNA_ID=CAMNT_0000345489 /DNA_START=108 /DNA_END=1472 /DNA_ORIENTATION=+ /assembly_acc=CAM_ASM_000159
MVRGIAHYEDAGGDCIDVNKIPPPPDDVEEEEEDEELVEDDSPLLPTSLMVSFDASGSESDYLCYDDDDEDDDDDGNISPSSISSDDDEHHRPFHDRRHEQQQVPMEISSPSSQRQHTPLPATHTPSYRRQARLKLQDCEQRASRQFGRPNGSPAVAGFATASSPTSSSSLQLQNQQQDESSRSSSPTSLSTNFRFEINKNTASYSFGPRVCMILCASVLMMMSGLDESINYHNHAGPLSSSSSLPGNGEVGGVAAHGRREEIVDFPLVVARAAASAASEGTGAAAAGAWGAESTMEEHQPSPLKRKGDLPKYYFPKQQQVVGGRTEEDATANVGGGLRHRHSNNLAMARASEHARPVFEEHPLLLQQQHQQQPLTLQKFYVIDEKKDGFHNTEWSGIHHNSQQPHHHQKRSLRRRFWSFVAWTSSLALFSLVLDTVWREYRRTKTIQEEERRL